MHNTTKAGKRRVAVFGAGIAGLSAAHEFARLGYDVSVFEANACSGGFFRSARLAEHGNMPSEYSWHGFGPWYHNAFDLLKQIPFDATGSVYDLALSRPIAFGLAPDDGAAAFDDTPIVNVKNMFAMTWPDVVKWSWLMLKTWTAGRRTEEHYATLSAAEQWRPLLSHRGWTTWRASFGPWIGSDWTNVSLHKAGQFFRKQLMTRPVHRHRGDGEGPAWTHGPRSGWLLLRGPSNEVWLDRWVLHLEGLGAHFSWRQPLHRMEFDGRRITRAFVRAGGADGVASELEVTADVYVLATSPFAAAEILARTPELERQEQLCSFRPLVQDGPHVQVSFRLAFAERIAWPKTRAALVIADSEFNLTIFAQEQVWAPGVTLGDGIRSLWTGTACVATIPGRVHGRPLCHCTKEQFIDEVCAQLSRCAGLDQLLKAANAGRGLDSFTIVRCEVWHEWAFSPDGIESPQPKWVDTTNTQRYLPNQATPVPNLVLAGAHTRTAADVWSIEAAVESGRRAARVVEPSVPVIPQYRAAWLRALAAADDIFFALRLPHFLDVALVALAGLIVVLVVAWFFA